MNTIINNKFNIGDYILVNDIYIGKIIKIIWNNNGYIIKLENYPNYIDNILQQYKLLETNNINGYKVVSLTDKIEIYNFNIFLSNLDKIFNEYIDYNIILNKLNNNFSNFISNIHNISNNSNINKNISKQNITNIFNDNLYSIYNEHFIINNISTDILDNDNINDFKNELFKKLEKFENINYDEYYDFKNSVCYKYLLENEDMDILSLGKDIIQKIKKSLLYSQKKIELTNDKLINITNLFDFIEFNIVGGYIEITNIYNKERTINNDILQNLKLLLSEYNKKIDHEYLISLLLNLNTNQKKLDNIQLINEIIDILTQEYIISIQPKVELLIWTINRLIYSWFSDKILFEKIFKIKILINLFKARNDINNNIESEIKTIIQILPYYGKNNAIRVISHMNYLFFPYKKIGLENSNPNLFNKIDDLMYYINGSVLCEDYIEFIKNNTYKTINNDLEYVI